MNSRSILRSALALAATLVLSTTANALLFRAYVASDGNDANPCTLPAPCRLLPAALAAVADGGEIWMLDSANYNTATVTIGKNVSILAVPGAVGSIVATGSGEAAISITASNLKITLRNVVIVPLAGAAGYWGVFMTGASTLTIEHSLFAELGSAVFVEGPGKVRIANSIMRNSNGFAVLLTNGAQGEISGSQMLGNGGGGVDIGAGITSTTTVVLSDSIISGGNWGIRASNNSSGGVTKAFVARCTIENTSYPLDSETNGISSTVISVSSSMIVNNQRAWYQAGVGSVIQTLGNNHIVDGPTPNTGVLTPLTPR